MRIKCKLCNKKFHCLSGHLRDKHNMTCKEYLVLFPEAKLTSEEYSKSHAESNRRRKGKYKVSDIGRRHIGVGSKRSWTPKRKEKWGERMRIDNPMNSEESRKRVGIGLSKVKTGVPWSSKQREVYGKILEENRIPRETRTCACGCGKTFEVPINSERIYYKTRCVHVGAKRSKETGEKISKKRIEWWAHLSDIEYQNSCKRSKEGAIERWNLLSEEEQNVLISKRRRGCAKQPNKIELKFDDILQIKFPNEWKYVGSGDVVIGGKIPDFINVNGKKLIIELFGDYWHGEEKTGNNKETEEQIRISHFKKYGFKTLIFWECELNYNNEYIVKKVQEFENENQI